MDPKQLAKDTFEKVVGGIAAKAAELAEPPIPGTPGAEPPQVDEPTEPRAPLPPKPDQGAPALRTATGTEVDGKPDARAQRETYLTTSTGARGDPRARRLSALPRPVAGRRGVASRRQDGRHRRRP